MNQSRSAVFSVAKVMVVLTASVISGCGLFQPGPQRGVKMSPHNASTDGRNTTAFSTPADLRLSFLREENSLAAFCAEPIPDVALGSETSASGSLAAAAAMTQSATAATNATLAQENEALRKDLRDAIMAYEEATNRRYRRSNSSDVSTSASGNASVNMQAAYQLATTVAQLGGRSQQVLLAREFLYRLCEARANGFITHEQAFIELQNNALKMIQSISAPVRPSAVAEQAELLKRVSEYLKERRELCNARKSTCEAAAKDDTAKKKCLSDHQQCTADIVPPKFSTEGAETGGSMGPLMVPLASAQPASEFILKVPEVTNRSPDTSEYMRMQKKLCNDTKNACEAVAPEDKAAKKACLEAHRTCIKDIKIENNKPEGGR